MTGHGATDGAIDAVIAAVAGPDRDAAVLTAALGRVSGARRELDQVEAALITAARAAGLSWARVGAALGLGSAQAAEQRAVRLAAAGAGAGGRDVPTWRRGRRTTSVPGPRPPSAPEPSAHINEPLTVAGVDPGDLPDRPPPAPNETVTTQGVEGVPDPVPRQPLRHLERRTD